MDTVFGNCIQALTGADPTEYGRNIVQLLSIPLASSLKRRAASPPPALP